jgi:hypothetical protein
MKATRVFSTSLIVLTGSMLLAFSLLALAQQSDSAGHADNETFDLDDLIGRISSSKSLGFFTKISLKNDIDNLLAELRDYHDKFENRSGSGSGDTHQSESLRELRERYDVMVHKLVVLLQDKDADLVKSIDDGREQLWAVLADKKRFAQL